MAIFKNILIPVDFSAHSNAALRLGSELAARFQSSITVLHVHELLPYGLPSDYEMYAPDLRQRVAQHALLGSVTERVVRTAPCPVLTVRAPEDHAGEAPEVWPPASAQ